MLTSIPLAFVVVPYFMLDLLVDPIPTLRGWREWAEPLGVVAVALLLLLLKKLVHWMTLPATFNVAATYAEGTPRQRRLHRLLQG